MSQQAVEVEFERRDSSVLMKVRTAAGTLHSFWLTDREFTTLYNGVIEAMESLDVGGDI